MPNVEIHGASFTHARNLRDRVFKLFSGKPYAGEMVVTIF